MTHLVDPEMVEENKIYQSNHKQIIKLNSILKNGHNKQRRKPTIFLTDHKPDRPRKPTDKLDDYSFIGNSI